MNSHEANLESGILTLQKNEEDIQKMFMHKSKVAKLVDDEKINSYRRLFFYIRELQKTGQLRMHPNYLQDNELATNIYKRKYYLKDIEGRPIESIPEQTFARLASFISSVENGEEKQNKWAVRFYNAMYDGKFLPGGRVIAGAGDLYRLKTLANCFVAVIDKDNLESIYKTAYECARTYSYGGGIGVDISVLRPKDSIVHNAADKSTGAVSFMEIYSVTTGLIGQSGRRGALMLTIDVKHPDVLHFIKVKKISNWVTNQIVEQCKQSGKFDQTHLDFMENKIRENTQVRFANISIKVSDEFMQAVEEQNKYGKRKILVYKNFSGISPRSVAQGNGIHYSYGMPSKQIDDYELFKTFDTHNELNKFLSGYSVPVVQKQDLDEVMKRDVFGDYVISIENEDFDLAVRYAGDFLLYFMSETTGEIKHLLKARDIWNSFVEGNYKTAEPGLIFWTNMIKYSPSNYVGR
ncbi:MAG: ribonucleotide reductase N-terminal alpha domain-containing protein, partial [Candidatus Aenigmatarchaeota archaeon]